MDGSTFAEMIEMAKENLTPLQTATVPDGQQALTTNEIYMSVLRDYPDVLDVNQVGAILGVSTKTVYRLLNEGLLASLKVGRAFKIPKLYVLQYVKVLRP